MRGMSVEEGRIGFRVGSFFQEGNKGISSQDMGSFYDGVERRSHNRENSIQYRESSSQRRESSSHGSTSAVQQILSTGA